MGAQCKQDIIRNNKGCCKVDAEQLCLRDSMTGQALHVHARGPRAHASASRAMSGTRVTAYTQPKPTASYRRLNTCSAPGSARQCMLVARC